MQALEKQTDLYYGLQFSHDYSSSHDVDAAFLMMTKLNISSQDLNLLPVLPTNQDLIGINRYCLIAVTN